MFISYFDDQRVTTKILETNTKKLKTYRESINLIEANNDDTKPEFSLFYAKDFELHQTLESLKKQFKNIKHLVLVGIGGSSLGTEAIHSVLDQGQVKLSVLDTISSHKMDLLLSELSKTKKVSDLAICVVSKSGNTTETLANASVLIEALKKKFGDKIFKQVILIGNDKNNLTGFGKKKGSTFVCMPEVIGGRYSVATAVGLVPLALLGHDTDDFIAGYLDASDDHFEPLVAESAARLAVYYKLKYSHYNFFAFETRLEKLGAWYRQLFAESLGKEKTVNGKAITHSMVPTISTPVELHSVGQMYLSSVPDTVTDFVTFDDSVANLKVAKNSVLAKAVGGLSLDDIGAALYGGVIAAYQERQLPYRATIFENSLPYSLGLFMSMRLRETMYLAHLLDLNAFDQPNVELYKQKTAAILKS